MSIKSRIYASILSAVRKLRLYMLVFFSALLLRAIPELIVPWYPIGYETITYYAPPMFRFVGHSFVDVFGEFFMSGPLLYILLWCCAVLSRVHPFLVLKMVAPLLYGCLAVSFFIFLKHGLDKDEWTAFAGTSLLIFQVATLRIAWDRLRNLLGLTLTFFALTALKSNHKYRWWLVSILAVLTVLSRDYIVLVFTAAVLGSAFFERKDRVLSLVACTPALVVFSFGFFSRQLWSGFIVESHYALSNYWLVVKDVSWILVVCYLFLSPLVLKGFRRNSLFDPLLGFLLCGCFSVVVNPWLVLPGYQRWLMLLVFPFSVYALRGLERFQLFNKDNFRKLMAVLLGFAVIGMGYSSGLFSYIWLVDNSWVPVDLVQSSIGWEQVENVKGVLGWLDENAAFNSSIITEERFYGWTSIYLERADEDIRVIIYSANSSPEPALEKALDMKFDEIYLIWYTDSSLSNFRIIYSLGSISVFQFGQ